MKEIIKHMPVIGSITRWVLRQANRVSYKLRLFSGSENYWIVRYASGENSGSGSYGRLAEFKAETINDFVKSNNVATIIEYGCGDGNQLKLSEYPSYLGFDISPKAISLCREIFRNDVTKNFKLMTEYTGEKAHLTLSLDVIYHLIEDDVYHSYMERLFGSAERFVIIYSSNYYEKQQYHERRRQFTRWIETNASHWKLMHHIPNKFPYNGIEKESSLSDFYIYAKD